MKAAAQQERFVSPTRFEPKDRDAPNQSTRYTERDTAMHAAFRAAMRQLDKPTPLARHIEALRKQGVGTFRKPEWRLQFGHRAHQHANSARAARRG